MKKVVVTGGAGFIGSAVIAELLRHTDTAVVCIDNFDETYSRAYKADNISAWQQSKNFTLYELDIVNKESLIEVFTKEQVTHVIHLAAKADTRHAVTNPYPYIETNIIGTLNVFEAALAAGVKHVVAASSSSVYGNNERTPWKESDLNLQPLSPYGVTKLSTEHLAYTYYKNRGLQITMLRYFNVYGERNRPGMVPYKWAEAFLTDGIIELSGDGTRRRDYTYIGDVVRATVSAMNMPLGYEVLNIGYGAPLSLRDLLHVFEDVTKKILPIQSRQSHEASVENTYADTTKAKELLGWQPEISHEVGIKCLLEWFVDHRLNK